MANLKYSAHKVQVAKGLLDLSDATKMKVMLVTTGYVGTALVGDNIATAIAGEIAAGGGYAVGGQVLTGAAITLVGTAAKLDANDNTWAASTITAGGAVIWFDDTGTDYPVFLLDFAGDKVSSNGDFKITWDANGIMTLD